MAHVTVPDEEIRVSYSVGATPTTNFIIPYTFFATTDNVCEVDGVLQVEGVDYTIAGNAGTDGGFEGGTLTFTVAQTNVTVVIYRDIPVARTTDFPTAGPFNVDTLNTQLDKLVGMMREREDEGNRALKQPETDTAALGVLPDKATRSTKMLAFDASGDPIATGFTDTAVQNLIDGVTLSTNTEMIAGSAATPGFPIQGDANTGIYSPAADQWGVALGGVTALLMTTALTTLTAGTGNDAHILMDSDLAAGTIGQIDMQAHSDIGTNRVYGRLLTEISDATDGSEDALIKLFGMRAGTLTEVARFDPDGNVSFFGNGLGNGIALQNTNTGATGVQLQFYQNSTSPAASDQVSLITFYGNNDGSLTSQHSHQYAAIDAAIISEVENSEEAQIRFYTSNNGAANTIAASFAYGNFAAGSVSPANNGVTGQVGANGYFTRGKLNASWEVISSVTPSAAATLDFSGLKDVDSVADAYQCFCVVLEDILPATDDDDLRIRMATNASAIDAGANYQWSWMGQITNSYVANSGTGATSISVSYGSGAANDVSNASAEGLSGILYFLSPISAAGKRVIGNTMYRRSSASALTQATVAGWHTTTGDLDDIRFLWGSGGNFQASGQATLYGLRRASG